MGCIWYVSICVLVILFNRYCSSCVILRFGVNIVWLCMHRMDVSDGSV